ncbi:PPE family protein [Mycobacterium intermedium]|uniref:PPE family protein n=1 Tax=Mycobacterium intermedium TaxID=28445 RepID=A0A1E3SIV8_MYCIE|nr:PPE family protein [Mycobacterium intermedium]MCV6967234.1 PPE family protein [Mycobacterium intermedium]ODR02051.1 hypothetical protein BHQ20_06465 [Mycobacterium intermedium]OPE50220.1 PPE family protein [Mycobacterium intermedium]ORB08994.1 PPE family protein [Mycobacterium intermedium]
MSAPIWMAAPPEVHSTLLSSGPGPGPLHAAAQAWLSLSTAYAETADELTALLAAVQAGDWDGPTSMAYVAGHLPYLGWLVQASADGAAIAAQHQTAAGAYTSALAAMPTPAELAANHAAHAALVATNFFGVNTIPIALNEADYARMWVQAAAVMSTYQTIASTALAAVPQTTAAPQIVAADAQLVAAAEALPLPPDQQLDFFRWLQDIGYIDFYDTYIQPLINALSELPFFQAMFSGFDPYLVILGNPLTYFSPFNIAFALGYPMDIGSYVAFLSQMFAFVALDLTAAFASGNPATISFTILFVTVEIIGTVITDTIALLKTLLEQTLVIIAAVVPLLTTPLVPLAAGAVLAPIGIKGLAALAAVPPPPAPVAPVPPPLAALAPTVPTSAPAPTPAPAEATVSTATPATSPPPTAAPPTVTGAGIASPLDAFGYLVGSLSSDAKRSAATGARKKAREPDAAEASAAGAPAPAAAAATRRKRAKAKEIDRGWGFMDLESDDDPPEPWVGTSNQGGGALGFAGTVRRDSAERAAGLITLADDAYADGPRAPVMPSTWDPHAAAPPGAPDS